MKDAHWKALGIIGILLLGFAVAKDQKTEIQIGKATLRVEVANTQRERAQGLSGRPSLKENEGMLFLFDKPGNYGFWMKDMNFPIDIIWVDQEKRVVGIAENISPDTFPETFYPPELVQYVLEVNAGFAQQNMIELGEIIKGL